MATHPAAAAAHPSPHKVAHPSTHLQSVMGDEIGNLVNNFDFSKMSTKDVTRDDYLHCDLAPAYNNTLTADAWKMMDDKLKIMIAGTVKTLEKIPPKERTWEVVISALMQNPLMEPDGVDAISRSDKLIKKSSSDFKFDGSPQAAIVKEVNSWFTKLISDDDVIRSIKFDINVLANIVAQSGATVSSFEAFFAKHEYHEKTIVDIGVLRFPDPDNPHFKVFRIQLTAWSDSQRILFHQSDDNGITGQYNCRLFKPRESVIAGMKEQSKKAAIKQADDMFT